MKRWVVRWDHPQHGKAIEVFSTFDSMQDCVLRLFERHVHFEVVIVDA